MTKAAIAAIDFDDLDTGLASEKPYEFELVHPASKEPLGVFISVVGPESAAFKAKVRKEVNRDRRRQFEAKRKGKDIEPTSIEEDEAFSIALVADLVTGWRTVLGDKSEPVIYWKKAPLEFTQENVIRWLTNFPWARTQIDAASGDLSNFLPS